MVVKTSNGKIIASPSLQTCDIPLKQFKIEPFTIVIFGGTGDLSRKKLLPTLLHLFQENELGEGFSILAVGRSVMSDEKFRQETRQTLQEMGDPPPEEEPWARFRSHLFYLSVPPDDDQGYRNLCRKIEEIGPAPAGGLRKVLYYMALPPQATPGVVEKLNQHGLCRGRFDTKIIVEKPFGQDFASARELDEILTRAFEERQIYRIDHYLAKETVQNIIFFRFSNSIFEQLWNRRYIDNIQITVAEDIGIENRAAFYEEAGVVRDIVQNHLLQIVGLVAMEPPIGFEADWIRDEKVKVLQAIQPIDGDYVDRYMVRGQYGPGKVHGEPVPGYRQEKGVPSDSNTQTFLAGVFYIANWRWAGVPFFVRAGKRMAKRITEIAIQFDQPPLKLFGRTCDALDPNVLVLTIQPEEKISLRFGVKYPDGNNQISSIAMNFSYQEAFHSRSHPVYERLIVDCLKGDLTLFVRQDQIEAMWKVVDPIIDRWDRSPPAHFPNYKAGTWGPLEARRLLEKEGRRWLTC